VEVSGVNSDEGRCSYGEEFYLVGSWSRTRDPPGCVMHPVAIFINYVYTIQIREYAVAQLVESLSTSRKVAGSIPDGFTGIFQWPSPSGNTMALGLTQPLTEMSTRNNSWG
jgi:hypothetical protein